MEDVKVDSVRPTDMGAPQRTVSIPIADVRVVIPPNATQALIHTKDGSVQEWVPISRVAVRMPKGEREAYFKAEMESGSDILHLGDRVANQNWR